MNKLESFIYQAVKHNPRIKNLVRDVYQVLFAMMPGPAEKSVYPVTVREGFFFGFHDKIPWSANNSLLLAHGYNNLSNHEPTPDDRVDIGYFQGEKATDFKKIATTGCFNWQQGSMLQWLGSSDRFIFNDAGEGSNVARIFNTQGQAEGVLSAAVSAVDPMGNKALSYNFTRLQRYFPGYGYMHGNDPEIEEATPSSHGISVIDIQKNLSTKLFSVRDIASFHPEKSMDGAHHFLTHCLFSPSGQRFIFFHRWIKDGNFIFTRMLSSDTNGKQLHIFPTRDMVSHIAWQDDSHVLAYCRSRENKDAYIIFEDMSEVHQVIGADDFSSDGHPSFARKYPEWFITDTYPDRMRRSYLILYNILKEKRVDLGFFRQPLQYKEAVRCDLHPRWNHEGTIICFDSAHTGKRALCTMDIGNILSTGMINTF